MQCTEQLMNYALAQHFDHLSFDGLRHYPISFSRYTHQHLKLHSDMPSILIWWLWTSHLHLAHLHVVNLAFWKIPTSMFSFPFTAYKLELQVMYRYHCPEGNSQPHWHKHVYTCMYTMYTRDIRFENQCNITRIYKKAQLCTAMEYIYTTITIIIMLHCT